MSNGYINYFNGHFPVRYFDLTRGYHSAGFRGCPQSADIHGLTQAILLATFIMTCYCHPAAGLIHWLGFHGKLHGNHEGNQGEMSSVFSK